MKRQLQLSFVLFVLMAIVMRWQGASLLNEVTPLGILDLEFAKTIENLFEIKQVWKESDFKTNIYLDFLFILSYTWFFVIACLFFKYRMRWKRYARIFILFSITTGLLDVCENVLMLMAWYDTVNPYFLEAAYICAVIKFLLIGFVLLFLLTGLSLSYFQKKYIRQRSQL